MNIHCISLGRMVCIMKPVSVHMRAKNIPITSDKDSTIYVLRTSEISGGQHKVKVSTRVLDACDKNSIRCYSKSTSTFHLVWKFQMVLIARLAHCWQGSF